MLIPIPQKKLCTQLLTHWGRVTHICVGNLAIIGSDNGLSPDRRQAIIWTNAGILLIGPFGTSVKFQPEFKHFHWSKCIWKFRLQNGVYLSRLLCVKSPLTTFSSDRTPSFKNTPSFKKNWANPPIQLEDKCAKVCGCMPNSHLHK